MVSRSSRFNIYLLLLVMLVSLTSCQSPEAKRNRQLARARVYLEVGAGRQGQTQQVTVLRAAPMNLTVETNPFLNEIHVASAQIIDNPGGFVLSIHMNQKGAWLLEQYTASHYDLDGVVMLWTDGPQIAWGKDCRTKVGPSSNCYILIFKRK